MIDHFDRTCFEAALPVRRAASISPMVPAFTETNKLWKPLGLVQGEYCYVVPVTPEVDIFIRSTIKADGQSASTAKDSIRAYLVDSIDRKPITAKDARPTRWITRVNGWERRLTETLRTLWKIGKELGTCPECHIQQRRLNRVKKSGVNHGRLFVTCGCNKYFKFLDVLPTKEKSLYEKQQLQR